jgi:hypothetical protein
LRRDYRVLLIGLLDGLLDCLLLHLDGLLRGLHRSLLRCLRSSSGSRILPPRACGSHR